uniref:Uncharacterized protein n=1 Tax=Kalanchoe fedtschenkoi TaxID=63787 RepID=A0A7N0V9Z9_KALFE
MTVSPLPLALPNSSNCSHQRKPCQLIQAPAPVHRGLVAPISAFHHPLPDGGYMTLLSPRSGLLSLADHQGRRRKQMKNT